MLNFKTLTVLASTNITKLVLILASTNITKLVLILAVLILPN